MYQSDEAEHQCIITQLSLYSRRSVFFNRTFINIIILGDRKAGKSSYLRRIAEEECTEEYIPSDDDERKIKKITQNGRSYSVNIFIPLNDKMFDLSTPYDYYLIFFDSTSLNSFEYARNLYISKLKTKNIKINDTLSSVIFVSTKNDRSGLSFREESVLFCSSHDINFFEISVKRNKGIDELDNKLVEIFDSDTFNERFKFID